MLDLQVEQEQLVNTAEAWLISAANFKVAMREIWDLSSRAIDDKVLLEAAKMFDPTDEEMYEIKGRMTTQASNRNVDTLKDCIKLKFTNNSFNIGVFTTGVAIDEKINELIVARCQWMYEYLNKSQDKEAGYKAICLSRDILRLKKLIEYGCCSDDDKPIRWEDVTPYEEYIDWGVDYTFLKPDHNSRMEEAVKLEKDNGGMSFWRADWIVNDVAGILKIKLSFLRRLDVFEIPWPKAE